MAEDPKNSGEKHKPPPPDISKAPPPPAPPIIADPPKEETSSAAPLNVAVAPDSSADDADDPRSSGGDEQVPGADASMANRVIAAAIDLVVTVGIIVSLSLVLPNVFGMAPRIAYLLGIGYFITRDSLSFLGGQSVGKMAMKIRAVTSEGASLSGNWQQGAVRNIAFLIPVFPLIELFVLVNRQDNPRPLLRLGDEWAKTKVVNAGAEVPAAASSPPADESTASEDSTEESAGES